MDRGAIAEKISALILEGKILKARGLDARRPLAGYGMDSAAMIQLVLAIEKEFGFEFDPEDMQLRNFSTIERIAALVRAKTGAR